MRELQTAIRFSSDPDPRYCASAFCRKRRLKRSTHIVTAGKSKHHVCSSCARKWESVRGARVEKIQEVAS